MFDKIHKIANNIIFKGINTSHQPGWVQNSIDILYNLEKNTETNLTLYKNADINELKKTNIIEKRIIADTISDSIIVGVTNSLPVPVQCGLHLIVAAGDELTTIKEEQKQKISIINDAIKKSIEEKNSIGVLTDVYASTLQHLNLMIGHIGVSASVYIGDTLKDMKNYISTKLINVFDTYEDILTTKINTVKEYVHGLKPHIENIISKFKNPFDITNYNKMEVLKVYKANNIITSEKSNKQIQSMKDYDNIIRIQKEENRRQLSETKQLEIKQLHIEKFIKTNENITAVGSICSQLLSLNGHHKEAKFISGFTNFHKTISSTVANIKLNKISFSSFTNIISGTLEFIGVLSNQDDGIGKALEQIYEHITKCMEAINENINLMRKELDIMRQENTNNFNKVFEKIAAIEVHIVTEIISASQINKITLLTLEQHIKTNSMYWERQHNTNERVLERFNHLHSLIMNVDTRNYLNEMILRNNEAYYNIDKLQYSYYRNSLVALLNQSHNISITRGDQPITQIGLLDDCASITITNAKNASQLVNIRGVDIDGIYFIDKYLFKITHNEHIECNIIDGYLPLYILNQLHILARNYNKRLIINDNLFEYEARESPVVLMHPLIFKLHFQTLLYSMLKMYNEADMRLIRINFEEIKQIQDITNILQNNITMFTIKTCNKNEIYTDLLNMKSILYNQLKSDYIKCLDYEKTIYMDTMLTEFKTKTLPDMYKSPPKIFNTNNIFIPDIDYIKIKEQLNGWYDKECSARNITRHITPADYVSKLKIKFTSIEQITLQKYKTIKIDSINKITYNSKINNMYTLTNNAIMELDKLPILLYPDIVEWSYLHQFNIHDILEYELELANYKTYYLASLYGLGKFEGTYTIEYSHTWYHYIVVTIKFTSSIMELNNIIHKISIYIDMDYIHNIKYLVNEDKSEYHYLNNRWRDHDLQRLVLNSEYILTGWYGLETLLMGSKGYDEDSIANGWYLKNKYETINTKQWYHNYTYIHKPTKKIVAQELLNPIDQTTFDTILNNHIVNKYHDNVIKNKDNDFHKSLNKYMKHNQSIQTFEYWMTGQYNEYITKIEKINMDYNLHFMDQFVEIEQNIDGINPHLEEYKELLQEVLSTVNYLSRYVCEGPSTTELIQHMAERIETTRQETLMLMDIVNTSGMDSETREQINAVLQRMNHNPNNLLL